MRHAPPLLLAHPWHGIPAIDPASGLINAFIEIVPTDTVKYEVDKASGHLKIDRPQRFSSLCPTLYGFVSRTYCGDRTGLRCAERTGATTEIFGDGDPLDVCVLTEKTVAHGGFLCHVRPVGGLRMVDGNQADDKIIAVLDGDVVYGSARDISDCPAGLVERLRHYFLSYKQQPGDVARRVVIAEIYGRDEAEHVLRLSGEDYRERFGDA